jgi:glycerol uptake facilitator protein
MTGNHYFSEAIGTFFLVFAGCGAIVVNDAYSGVLGHVGVCLVFGLVVMAMIYAVGNISGAHLNPAVTLGLAAAGNFAWGKVIPFILAQMAGAAAGAGTVWLFYRHHFNRTEDPVIQLGCFATSPAIRKPLNNLISEVIGTFVLIFVILYIADPSILLADGEEVKMGLGTLGALPVALLVTAIGLSLGGTTGYAINPARDLGPRIMHALLPMDHKGNTDWNYAWIPVLGPITGALIAAGLFLLHGFLIP